MNKSRTAMALASLGIVGFSLISSSAAFAAEPAPSFDARVGGIEVTLVNGLQTPLTNVQLEADNGYDVNNFALGSGPSELAPGQSEQVACLGETALAPGQAYTFSGTAEGQPSIHVTRGLDVGGEAHYTVTVN